MDFQHFKESFKKTKLLPMYVIYGEEEFFVHEAVSLIRARILEREDAGVSLTELYGDETSATDIIEELETLPFFGSDARRLIVVYGSDKLVARGRDQLKEYLDSPSPFGYLVLVCAELDKRTSFYNKLRRMGGVISCERLPEEQLLVWIADRAGLHGKQISLDACSILAENIGSNLAVLASHIEKLAISVGRRREIKTADIEELVGAGRLRNVFELTGAVARRDFPEALKILGQFLNTVRPGEEIIKTVPPLRWQINRLWRAKRIMRSGGDREALAYSLHVPKRYVDELVEQVRQLSEEDLERDYRFLLEADLEGKLSTGNNRIILEKLIYNLCK